MSPGAKCFYTSVLFFLFLFTYTYSQSVNQYSLSSYLKAVEKKYQVTFLFDSDLVREINIASDTLELPELSLILQDLNLKTAFLFSQENTSILVSPKYPGANLKICATLIDSETKGQVPGANIVDSQRALGVSSNESGYFETYANLTAVKNITISSIGFVSVEIPTSDFNTGDGACKTIFLNPETKVLSEVVINAYMSTGMDYSFKDNSIEMKPTAMGLLPGETDADILMALDALPGVNSPDSKAGNLLIRGSSPDQSLITFDNIPIYHKGHYFGTLSPYNPAVVENVKVQRSGYPAEKGGRVGGVIEINSKRNIADSAVYGIGLSTTYASAFTEIPIIKDKVSIMLATRTSYPSNWVSPKLNAINEFIYQESRVQQAENEDRLDLNERNYRFNDYNAKIISKLSRKDNLSLSFMGIDNRVKIEIENTMNGSIASDKMRLQNYGYTLQWNRNWSDRVSSRLSGIKSLYQQSYTSRTKQNTNNLSEDSYFENSIEDLKFTFSNDVSLTKNVSMSAGYEFQRHEQVFINRTINSDSSNNPNTFLHSLYSTISFSKPSKYIFTLGLRNNYYSLSKDFKPEPRVMFNYFLSDKWAFKSSAGLFHQYVTQISGVAIESVGGIENLVWQIADEDKIPIVHSNQLMAGFIFHNNSWIVDIEFYHNKIQYIAINDIIRFSSSFLYGDEKTIGTDLLIKKQWTNFDGWISYSLSHSTLDFDSIQTETFDFIFNQTHVFDIVASYKFKQWKLSTGWKYRSGLPALPGIRTRYLHGPPSSGGPPPPPGSAPPIAPNSPRMYRDDFPSYHQLDISLVYLFPKRKHGWSGSVGLSLLNVYNRKNLIEQVPRPTPQGLYMGNKYAIGFAPNLVVTVKW